MNPILIQSDARALPLADGCVHCVVTSPPYWGLRDYGVAGQIGLEPTLAQYLATMVGVFREVRRVLRADGTCWVNMGDAYAHGVPGGGCVFAGGRNDGRTSYDADKARGREKVKTLGPGLKPKDLLMQPHRLAIALQEDGWYVRSDIVWHKPNPMPESVTDRPTKSHEYIFLLSKSARYFFDQEGVKEAVSGQAHARGAGVNPKAKTPGRNSRIHQDRDPAHAAARHPRQNESFSAAVAGLVSSRNIRTVWTMPTRPCKEAHFATFPIDLPTRCIKAGTSEKGVCPHCGSPWKRVVERVVERVRRNTVMDGVTDTRGKCPQGLIPTTTTTHWLPTCKCPAHEPIPATVLDPFGGAATTALACLALGRRAVIVERKWEYLQIGRRRIENWTPARVKKPRTPRQHKEPLLFP